MNNPDKRKQLTALLDASRQMLECASSGDWEPVDKLQVLCEKQSRDLFSVPVTTSEAAVFADAIREILSINQSITDLGLDARETCLQNVGEHKHNRQAIREYTAHTD